MSVTSAIVLFAITWFMTFLVALPIRVRTQGEAGKVVPGTHSGAPEVHNLGKKALISTLVAVAIWGVAVLVILSGWITVRDLDWMGWMAPPE